METHVNILLPDTILDSLEFQHSFIVNRAGYYQRPSDYHMERDGIEEAVLILCLDGCGYAEYKGKRQEIHRGDVVFLEPRTYHSYGTRDDDPWTILWVHFSGSGLPALLSLFKKHGLQHIFHLENRQPAAEQLEQIVQLLSGRYAAMDIYKACCKLELLLFSFFEASPPSPKDSRYIEEAVRFMKENLYGNMDLQALSRHLGLTSFHTIRIFKSAFMTTPMQYYNALRLDEAGRQLLHTDDSVAEISRRFGYSSQFHFSQNFKKKTGLPPTEYRKMMRCKY
ncbi:MAG TPA: AraC family transcriptional regulator [Firmicutes bacterium]|nr:AraC family transcriptional regulator [Bacillota bacterium]